MGDRDMGSRLVVTLRKSFEDALADHISDLEGLPGRGLCSESNR
jgi:hypothetical protein